MDVARLNFSHGTHASHAKLVRLVRKTATALSKPIAIMGDLQGPKIRLGVLPEAGISLPTGSVVIFITENPPTLTKGGAGGGTSVRGTFVPVTYANLYKDVAVGHRILMDDGLLEAVVTKIFGKQIFAEMKNGGLVTSHKGMNFPDSTLKVSALTKKDHEDIVFGVEQGVEWLALSFVTSAKDVKTLRSLIKKAGKPNQILPRIIVKIEKHEAIKNFKEILDATDAVMVARGDLGVEIPAQEVPERQKEIIELCRHAGKPVVVATQMLDSMIRNPRPTRAEVSDVANAVFDHADGVMLSGESASGKYPMQAVKMMAQIVEEAEASKFDNIAFTVESSKDPFITAAQAIKLMVIEGTIDGVLASQELAEWSESILRAHPEVPFYLAVPNLFLQRQTVLRWGVTPFILKNAKEETFVKRAILELKKQKKIKNGMRLAVVMGGTHGDGFDCVVVD